MKKLRNRVHNSYESTSQKESNMIFEFKPIKSPYFGESGLTSTSAQTYANRAKHAYESLESYLNNVNFVVEKFGLIGTNDSNFTLAKDAYKDCSFEYYNDVLTTVTRLKGFIAFLREAIKEKDRLASEVPQYMSKERYELECPTLENGITEQEVIDNMSVKDRQTYLSLETKCAVFGKFIHPGQPFDRAIKRVETAVANPRVVDYNGRDTIVHTYTPSESVDYLNEIYIDLQKEHRKAEASLNGLKHQIEETVKKDTMDKLEAYNQKLQDYHKRLKELELEEIKIRDARYKEIQNLKIVIPNEYKDIFESLK